MAEILEGIDKLDDRTVRIRLSRPEAPFLANSRWTSRILSAEYAQALLKEGAPGRLDQERSAPARSGSWAFQKDVAVATGPTRNTGPGSSRSTRSSSPSHPNPAVRLDEAQGGECHVMASRTPRTWRASRPTRR